MEPSKMGKLIGTLRRRDGLTQQQLGELLGVTNKTVSRWENGNYLPDLGMLPLLAETFHITVDELLAGQLRAQEEPAGDPQPRESSFSLAEKRAYFIRKWRQDHVGLFVLLALLPVAIAAVAYVIRQPWIFCALPLVIFVEYAWQNHRMMCYVEDHLYGD